MIEYQDAVNEIISRTPLLPSEKIPLTKASGRTLARDVKASENIPPFNRAAMDGYAVRSSDTVSASSNQPVVLKVIEDLPAGKKTRQKIRPAEAIRIMTGAPLPGGADAVVMVEFTERTNNKVMVKVAVKPGENVARAGEDVKKGELALEKGRLLQAAEIGLLAALGYSSVPVTRKPEVAIISTGDEIVKPDQRRGPGQIRDANGYSLYHLALEAGAEAFYLGIARDSGPSLKNKLRLADSADIVVLSGGVSIGDYDLVKDGLIANGVTPVFWKARIKPGKPVFFGLKKKQLVFGLPGNPASAMVTFNLFARPAIDTMLGRKNPGLHLSAALLDKKIKVEKGRTQFIRGTVTSWGPELKVIPCSNQKSGTLNSMVQSQVLIVLPPDIQEIEAGSPVDILFLRKAQP